MGIRCSVFSIYRAGICLTNGSRTPKGSIDDECSVKFCVVYAIFNFQTSWGKKIRNLIYKK